MRVVALLLLVACGSNEKPMPAVPKDEPLPAAPRAQQDDPRHTVENGIDVLQLDTAPYCFDKQGVTLCQVNIAECTSDAGMSGALDRGCYPVSSAACFFMTDIESGERRPWCAADMTSCTSVAVTFLNRNDRAGVTRCMIVRAPHR